MCTCQAAGSSDTPISKLIIAQRKERRARYGKPGRSGPSNLGPRRSQGAGRHDLGNGLFASADNNFLTLRDMLKQAG
jgi:hypothetical protein